MTWRVRHVTGDVGTFHARELPAEQRAATFFTAEAPALVLGSSQREESVNAAEAREAGIAIVRRRSGGGGVLVWPGEFVWLDLEIPASDVLWHHDVGAATWWVGELWRSALGDVEPTAAVHRGRMVHSRWSADVCFAGTGPGEVMVDGAKLVGISQRRTRTAARFQTMVHLRWRPETVARLVAASPSLHDIAPLVRTTSASAATITSSLIAALAALD